ncbi:pyrroloquinoline quinone biosynthesis peptide chaperone PqqD [Parasalinivibrio latis]|uniref:pyrroloquinoline quinone biosynthesis peptide chaperone PqqD n=1 Tax=Parasalinivibrio latis TaxID=2952610 RepID=UPI0030DF7BF0
MSEPLKRDLAVSINPLFRMQYEKVQGCHVLLFPEGMVKLSDTAAEILSHVDGVRSPSEVIAVLQQKYPGADTLADDVTEFFGVAYDKKWIQQAG